MTYFLRSSLSIVVAISAGAAFAQARLEFTEPRNAAAAFVGTTNFVVGRMARECYQILNESESFVKAHARDWQLRNEKFYAASVAYMGKLLDEAEHKGGAAAKQSVLSAYTAAVRGDGTKTIEDWMKKGDKLDVCRKHVALAQQGELDIKPGRPFYEELQGLVNYFEGK
jgi:hypothetical protein